MKINEKNLCVFATTPPFDCEGFLNKRGEVNKAFQRRYFVLKGNLLFYFEKKGDKEPLGLIIVEGCTIELSEESDQYCFEIAFNGNRTYVLSADSQECMEAWMKALTCAGYEYKKLVVAELQRQLEEIECSRNKATNVTNISVPRPPPRRQNPFNRPAPALPGMNNNNNATTEPFINGHFGSTMQRSLGHTHQPSGPALQHSPIPPLRSNKNDSNRQQPYQQHCSNSDTPAVLKTHSPTLNVLRNKNNRTFEQLHEKFREVVMKDVLEYRSQQLLTSQPLIEL
ncbi:sesquipedalian-1 [Anastrepha ludens]|uniref:sesquipedalian-1 n=1 Tax=Anastrepha ludens TaxID=28586 RepID=UPI0023B11741|nr:sesquipedalian-1 [Anastrepha ludens]